MKRRLNFTVLGVQKAVHDEFFRLFDSSKSAEDTASDDKKLEILSQQVNEVTLEVTTNDPPAIREAVKFVLRGGWSQSEASKKYNVPESTLNDRIAKARERFIQIRRAK